MGRLTVTACLGRRGKKLNFFRAGAKLTEKPVNKAPKPTPSHRAPMQVGKHQHPR
jgi:hypothetical protein